LWMIIIYIFAAIAGWCFLAHCVFMRCCTCMKRPQKLRYTALNNKTVRGWKLNGAHRGGGSERAENTTAAFQNAMAQGLNLMECDVHMSKDGEVVVAHDASLERMCGPDYADKKVSDYNFSDLPQFQQHIPQHFDDGSYTVKSDEPGRFTLLRELFESAEGIFISIDMKDKDDALCHKVNEMVREYKREDLTFWGSMFAEQHATVQSLNPRVACFFSGKQVIKTYLWWLCGCLWCCALPSDAFMTAGMTERNHAQMKQRTRNKGRN